MPWRRQTSEMLARGAIPSSTICSFSSEFQVLSVVGSSLPGPPLRRGPMRQVYGPLMSKSKGVRDNLLPTEKDGICNRVDGRSETKWIATVDHHPWEWLG